MTEEQRLLQLRIDFTDMRYLERDGHCIMCGKPIEAHKEEVIRFRPFISKVNREVSLCFDCIDYLYMRLPRH